MNSLQITKIILRFAFGISASLYFGFILSNILSNGPGVFSGYLLVYCLFFLQAPALFILFISSIYNYITQRALWSILKTEYYFLFANIAAMVLFGLSRFICPSCSI